MSKEKFDKPDHEFVFTVHEQAEALIDYLIKTKRLPAGFTSERTMLTVGIGCPSTLQLWKPPAQ